MDIYGDTQSGNCMKVKYTADLLGLAYNWVPIDIMKGESRTPAFLRLNPHGQVPVVVFDDGRTLSQSNAIILHLAENTHLLPEDGFERAKVAQWLFWEQYSQEPYIAVCRYHMLYLQKSKETREGWRVERGEAALNAMERQLSAGKWLAGERFSIADISLYAYTHLAHEGGFDLAARPQLQRWIGDCREVIGGS